MSDRDNEEIDISKKICEKGENDELRVDTSQARILSHIDIIKTCHFAIADTPENRKIFENYICTICAKIKCTGTGRCKATAMTIAQINLLTPIVSFRDEGSAELGIEGFDRVMTIGDAIRPFNLLLSDYFKEGDNQIFHAIVCMAKRKDSDINLGNIVIPKDYNVKVEKIFNG